MVSNDLPLTTGSGNLLALERGGRLLYRRPGGADPDGSTQLIRGGQTAQTQCQGAAPQGTEDQADDGHSERNKGKTKGQRTGILNITKVKVMTWPRKAKVGLNLASR